MFAQESPIKTWFLLLADTEADSYKDLLEGFKKVAGEDQEKVLYIIVSKNNEKAAAKKYFGGVDFEPAVFLVGQVFRSDGSFANFADLTIALPGQQDLRPVRPSL